MIDPKHINELVRNIFDALPEGLKNIPQDTEAHLRAAIQNGFSKMDLVTREEFDTQVAVLKKTREKLEKLEVELKKLEAADQD